MNFGREPERGLVEQQQARARDQRAPDRQHLLLAAAQRRRHLLAPLRQHRKRAGTPCRCRLRFRESLRVNAPMRRLSITVMRLRIARPSGTWLRPSATILCAGRRAMLRPSKSDRARGRPDQAGDGLEQRRLAGAVRADQRDDLAALDRQTRRRAAPRSCRSRTRKPWSVSMVIAARPRRDRPRSPRGSFWIASGGPSAILVPKLSTVTRSEMPMTSLMSCSTRTMVMPRSRMRVMISSSSLGLARVHAGRRLVQQQELRARRERARHLELALLAIGQVGGA